MYGEPEKIYNENRIRIELLDLINMEADADNLQIRIKLMPDDEQNMGIMWCRKNELSELLEYINRYFLGESFAGESISIKDDYQLCVLDVADGELHIRFEYMPYHHSLDLIKADITGDNIRILADSIKSELERIDWDEYGKIDYLRASLPNPEIITYKRVYSAIEFEALIKELISGKKLHMVLVDMFDYIEYSYRRYPEKGDSIWFDESNSILLVFDDFSLELIIDAIGMFQYRVLHYLGYDKITKHHGYLSDDFTDYKYAGRNGIFIDGQELFDKNITGQRINEVTVEKTWDYAFGSAPEYQAASEKNDLPATIVLSLDNDIRISLMGSDIEYYGITVE